MYKDSGGGLERPESVESPASGAMVLMGLNAASALISMIFLIRIHQRIYKLMQSFAHLILADFH